MLFHWDESLISFKVCIFFHLCPNAVMWPLLMISSRQRFIAALCMSLWTMGWLVLWNKNLPACPSLTLGSCFHPFLQSSGHLPSGDALPSHLSGSRAPLQQRQIWKESDWPAVWDQFWCHPQRFLLCQGQRPPTTHKGQAGIQAPWESEPTTNRRRQPSWASGCKFFCFSKSVGRLIMV